MKKANINAGMSHPANGVIRGTQANEIVITFDEQMLMNDASLEPTFIPLCKAMIRWMESEQDSKANIGLRNSWFKFLENNKMAKPDYQDGVIFFRPEFKNHEMLPMMFRSAFWRVVECCEVEGIDEEGKHDFFAPMVEHMLNVSGGRILIRRKK